jgi:hypothetical protein
MPDLPSGTVTFLFTDIEGSTALSERDRAAMEAAVERHLDFLRVAIAGRGPLRDRAALPTASDTAAAALAPNSRSLRTLGQTSIVHSRFVWRCIPSRQSREMVQVRTGWQTRQPAAVPQSSVLSPDAPCQPPAS